MKARLFAMVLAALFLSTLACAQEISIVPRPMSVEAKEGVFVLDGAKIITDGSSQDTLARYLTDAVKSQTSIQLDQNKAKKKIVLTTKKSDQSLGDEGYELIVDRKTITIRGPKDAGLFYGVQTLLQLIPVGAEKFEIPCVKIKDKPRFGWRGLHLDESRHFFGFDFVKKYIDLLAMHKMNVFHWHLVDDHGWRLEIKKYPRLIELGAWRTGENGKDWNYRNFVFAEKGSRPDLYGGYYTQDQVREIVAYAKERHVTIVPEIEMPGHSWAALVAYPDMVCQQTKADETGQHQQTAFCAGNEKTFTFLQDVLDETLELFDSEFIHIGGDEVVKSHWQGCSLCQKRMADEGLANANELQSYFIKRMENYLNAKGRRLIGWDEILQGGLAPNATVMSWRGTEGGITAAQSGHDVIMTPVAPLYLDAYQGEIRYEPKTISYNANLLEDVYKFEPVAQELTAEQAKHVLGAQGNAWAEWMFDTDKVEYNVYPRACAIAELTWSPKELRDWDDFQARMETHYLRLDQKDVNYRRESLKGVDERNIFVDSITAAIEKPDERVKVYYTIDGTEPGGRSTLYTMPITIKEPLTLKAVGIYPNGRTTKVLSAEYRKAKFYEPAAVDKQTLQQGVKYYAYAGYMDTVERIDKEKAKMRFAKGFDYPSDIATGRLGAAYEGYLEVPAEGIYTFYCETDDGSALWINCEQVVNNDGPHKKYERSGQIALKPGLHPFEFKYFDCGGSTNYIKVSFEGPGICKTAIGADMLYTEKPQQSLVKESKEEFDRRMEWWRDARFGMFIHWGLYAVPAGEWEGKTGHGEWIMHTGKIEVEQYERFAQQFNPVKFDAAQWVRMAKDAGMKYIVITSKHHDGFAIYDSKVSNYDITDTTPFKRDVLKELAAECKKQDIRLCLYYSIMDWHHPDYLPRRDWEKRSAEGADINRYFSFMKTQLKEVVENYDPAVLWFDGEWEETWTSELGRELYNYVRSLKRDIIINNRVGKGRGGMAGIHDATMYTGDFGTPEQEIPATGIPGYDWETCMTMNRHWGYNSRDKDFKSSKELIQKLVDIASKGGNFLLNVGPTEQGTFPQESVDRLAEIGKWMKVNGESIYNTSASIFTDLKWGRSTTKDNIIYLHVFDRPADGLLLVPGLKTLPFEAATLSKPQDNLAFEIASKGMIINLPEVDDKEAVTVIRLQFSNQPQLTNG